MPQSALDSSQLEALRGTDELKPRFTNRVRVSTNPNAIIYSMRVNQAAFDSSFAQITYDGGSGTLADIWPGMRVLISHTNDKSKAYFSGRVRKTPTSSILYVNENSYDVQDNDYIWIIDDFPIADRLAREVSGVQYNDYDVSFRQLLPIIYGLNTVYAGDVDPDTGNLTLTLSASLLITTSGASAGTLTWSVGAASITAGNSHTASITVDVPEGHQYIHLIWPDSGGRTAYFHIEVHAHGESYPYQLMAVENLSLSRNVGTGDDATLTNYVPVTGLLDLTQITVWSDDTYQNLSGSITGDNILYVGRIRTRENATEADETYSLNQTAAYTIEGVLTQLARIEILPFEMLNVASPTKWGEINNLTLYRGIAYLLAEYTTFLEVHSLEFDTFDNTYIAPSKNPSGDILTAVNDLALSINAALQIAPNGSAEVVRNGVMLETTGARNALTTRANVTSSDLISIRLKQDGARPVGRLTASGGSYNTSTGQYAVTEAISPGTAQGEGSQTATLDRQVLPCNLSQAAADTLLKTRANHALEKAQQVDTIDATFTPGWHSALIPSLNTWYTFDVPVDLTVDGQVIGKTVLDSSIRWLLTAVTADYDAEGAPSVKASFIRETSGISKGLTVVYPPPVTSVLPVLPSVPSIPMFQIPPIALPDAPTGTQVPVLPSGSVTLQLPLDGNAWVVMGELDSVQTLLLTTTMLIRSTPYTRDIVPLTLTATEIGRDVKINPFRPRGLYALYYDSASNTSRVFYTADCTAYPVVWSAGEVLAGDYTEMRVGNANGSIILLKQSGGGDEDITYDFTTGTHGWAAWSDAGYSPTTQAAYSGGTGWTHVLSDGVAFPNNRFSQVQIEITVPDVTFYSIDVYYENLNKGNDNDITVTNPQVQIFVDDVLKQDIQNVPAGSGVINWTGSESGGTFRIGLICGFRDDAVTATGTGTITKVVINRSGNSETVYSTDFGDTFDPPRPTDVAAAWIDHQKAGSVALVGGEGQTQKSSSGGSWANYGGAKGQGAGYIPRNNLTANSSNSGATPQYVLAAVALDGGESVWVVSASGATFANITPSSGGYEGLATGPRCLTVHWLTGGSSSHILAVLIFNTTVKLAVSLNGGSTWRFSSALNASAFGIVTQRGDRSKRLAGWANGSKVAICRNYQTNPPTFVEKTLPLDTILSLDVFG